FIVPLGTTSRSPIQRQYGHLTRNTCRYVDHQDLPSFPTRRSSDLDFSAPQNDHRNSPLERPCRPINRALRRSGRSAPRECSRTRSEEHTSELQSREKLVCRLLLEKKKKKWDISNEAV